MPAIAVKLTTEQIEAIGQLLSFPKAEQTLGGYAGTGKTTVIKTLARRLPRFAVCAFTGKAANVLRRKGVRASTIHSLIYKPSETERINGKGQKYSEVSFVLQPPYLLDCDGFIVDEASMVSRELYDDLCSYGLPIIFVGDHGQLEPVGDGNFNLMAQPDITLEKVHRNAGEIAQFANFIREGNKPVNWRRHKLYSGKRVRLLKFEELGQLETDPDQIICAYNKTRVALNKFARREVYEYPADRPVVGDRVMCLQNDNNVGVFNGMQGEILALIGDEMIFRSDGEDYRVRIIPEQFNNPKPPQFRDKTGRIPFDYCYAVTCHKAQGDEWDSVLVLEQRCRAWEHRRWAYTAASRARKELTWVPHNW